MLKRLTYFFNFLCATSKILEFLEFFTLQKTELSEYFVGSFLEDLIALLGLLL